MIGTFFVRAASSSRRVFSTGWSNRRHDKFLGGAFGFGFSKNVIDGYRFLLHNFESNDEIFLFGFSRGAYTARSIAGFIRNCGILKKEHADRIEEAFKLYRRKDAHPDSPEAEEFRKKYAMETPITFVGVWDTVGSLGIPIGIFNNFDNQLRHFN